MAINIIQGYNPSTVEPIDSRFVRANQAARYAIATFDAYNGLVVYQTDTKELFVLVDKTNISNAAGWQQVQNTAAFTGSFTGSFTGDGSQLTGIVTTLVVTGSSGNGTVDLKNQALTIAGTANEVETSMSGQTLTIGLPNNVTISGDLTVQGTASFQSTENLLVADRFVLFASGSTSTGDGGIVVQQGTQNVGELFGYDSSTTRWGFTSSFNASNGTAFAPVVYVGAVQTGTAQTAASAAPLYGGSVNGHGTIHVDTDDSEIWIYA
jgi:hypothetical protein